MGWINLIIQSNISPAGVQIFLPNHGIRCKQSERLKLSVVDVQIKATFYEEVPAATEAFVVVVSGRMLNFQSDG